MYSAMSVATPFPKRAMPPPPIIGKKNFALLKHHIYPFL